MPQVTVFVRKDDLHKWKAITKKSEWLSNKLALEPDVYLLSPKLAKENPELVKTFDKIATVVGKAQGDLCKIHGIPLDARGKCLQKGCKYA